ncbi:MAG TPA: hypothetical protein VFR99_06785 [Marmoricola sp.]|nr:hypothetical protein [Marmoricola sp.]
MCPSAPPSPGAVLLAITGPDGRPAYLPRPLPVDGDFVALLDGQPDVDQRFRFSAPCIQHRCAHWQQGGCSIPGKLAADPAVPVTADLPRCSIRRTCRWFAQLGGDACRRCPAVVRTAQE